VKSDDETEHSRQYLRRGGQAVVSGVSNGSVLVWDRKKGNMVYGLKHGTGEVNNFSKGNMTETRYRGWDSCDCCEYMNAYCINDCSILHRHLMDGLGWTG
jgi:hypothetical protein